MSQDKKKYSINVIEYYNWISIQKLKYPKKYKNEILSQEQIFLQDVGYPMFYNKSIEKFKTPCPFPLVLKDYSSKKPKYVIDNDFFTILFFSQDNLDGEICWNVYFHIKDHSFCDKRLKYFKSWYTKYYEEIFVKIVSYHPIEFQYSKFDINNEKSEDFSIQFWNNQRDFMLFKLFDIFRLF